jgi:hypothetical protein
MCSTEASNFTFSIVAQALQAEFSTQIPLYFVHFFISFILYIDYTLFFNSSGVFLMFHITAVQDGLPITVAVRSKA